MTVQGIDAAWGRPTPQELVAAGKYFIVGYVSHDPAKNLTAHECQAYLGADVAVGLVWETTARRANDGAAAGRADGTEARRQAGVLGFPADRLIYTAVDFDATADDLANRVGPYLRGFASTVGGVDLAGVYGGLRTVSYALDHGLVGHGWQTYAWSHGQWDTRAQLQQYRNGVPIAGHDTDLDRAADLAAFWTRESDMTITDADAQKIASTLLGTKLGKSDITVGVALQSEIRDEVNVNTDTETAALQAALVAQGAQLDQVLAILAGLTGEAIPVTGTVTLTAVAPPVTGA